MKAIGVKTSLPIREKDSLIEFEMAKPVPAGRDLLVRVKAVSVNPVDYKVRESAAKGVVLEAPRVLGWDAAGVVEAVGSGASLFRVGDEVFYAGSILQPGSNSEFQVVDERIVGRKPKKASDEDAAAIPLTALTAWESIFDRLRIEEGSGKGKSVLIIGGAGGVGSVGIQLLKRLTHLHVIATASRPETIAWCKKMGADTVVSHAELVSSVRSAGFQNVDFILNFYDTKGYWTAMAELIKPQGSICGIVNVSGDVNLDAIKGKSVSFSWESMFTRSMFKTDDMIAQHHILNRVSEIYDKGEIQTTRTKTLSGLRVENFKEVHALLESGKSIGKVVIKY